MRKLVTLFEYLLGKSKLIKFQEIYQRSLQLESSSTSTFDAGKKKFPWFQK